MSKVDTLAFISLRYSETATIGGAETLIKKMAIDAAESGKKVTFLTTCASDHFTWKNDLPEGSRTLNNIEVIYFPVDEDRDIDTFFRIQDRISYGAKVSRSEEELWLSNNINSSKLIRYLQENGERFDRIVAGPYLFGLIYNASLIHPEKTLMVPCLHDESFAYLDTIKEMFRSVRGFMFNSVPERDLAINLYFNDVPPDDMPEISVVGMGLDSFDYDSDKFALKHSITAPYIIYCGRREPLKGTPLLLDYINAFRSRTGKDVKVVLTGSGPFEPPAELAPHIIDAGFLSEEDKQNAMAGAHAFIHPSINESFGIVLLESWLSGTAALVHGNSSCLRYQCEASNGGLWFRAYPEFEEALMIILDDENVRNALALSGKEYVQKNYSREAVKKNLLTALSV